MLLHSAIWFYLPYSAFECNYFSQKIGLLSVELKPKYVQFSINMSYETNVIKNLAEYILNNYIGLIQYE